MLNFEFKNPVKIIFGKGQIVKIAQEIPANAKILLLYGGGSIKSNGIYDQVMSALAAFDVTEFGGIPANPEYEVLTEALKVIKTKGITYLLAVGGGSVIDGTKFLSAAALYQGNEPWDILKNKIRTEQIKECHLGRY
ncbi:iron-containing alcohol dehydrogenase [Pedobacter sp. NJ-S-72]